MTEIDDVIQGLDKNIKFLESPYRLENKDIKGLLIDIIGTIRDMWEKFNNVFKMVDKLMEIEKSAEKGEKCKEDDDPSKIQDIKKLYV